MTNAKKAAIIAFVNAVFALALTFDLPISDSQQGALGLFVNAVLGLYVAMTYKDSPMRIPEGASLDDFSDVREPMA